MSSIHSVAARRHLDMAQTCEALCAKAATGRQAIAWSERAEAHYRIALALSAEAVRSTDQHRAKQERRRQRQRQREGTCQQNK